MKMILAAVTLTLLLFNQAALAGLVTSPPQPESGPGGKDYAHASVTERAYDAGDLQYWLFEPTAPKPKSAPVIIFGHGWSAMKPSVYKVWIEHLVRRGNIVIYPRYQGNLTTPTAKLTSNAIEAVKNALKRLQTEPGHVLPLLNKVAVVGHSAGGAIAANMSVRAAESGLPPMRAVMCVEPGKTWGPKITQIPIDDVKSMPASTLLLTIGGDRDMIARNIDAVRIFKESVQVPLKNKNYVLLVSDDHGSPPLVADHHCPCSAKASPDTSELAMDNMSPSDPNAAEVSATPGADTQRGGPIRELIKQRLKERMQAAKANKTDNKGGSGKGQAFKEQLTRIDALDYYGLWKLFDGLTDAAFYNRHREYALGNTPQQRYMGKWSDGVPVKEMIVTNQP